MKLRKNPNGFETIFGSRYGNNYYTLMPLYYLNIYNNNTNNTNKSALIKKFLFGYFKRENLLIFKIEIGDFRSFYQF